jgi:hypothetical protein
MGIVGILVLLILLPLVFIIVGIVMVFFNDPAKRKRGRLFLLGGVLALLVEVLIGYSICSNLHIGGGFH